jgi:hypothetical protein
MHRLQNPIHLPVAFVHLGGDVSPALAAFYRFLIHGFLLLLNGMAEL